MVHHIIRKAIYLKYILENSKSVEYYTNLKDVFRAINNIQTNYNWLLTDLECNYYVDKRLRQDKVWISGVELTELVYDNDIQFIWGVLSGFNCDINIDIDNLTIVPYADMNRGLWSPNVEIQHPKADVEIVCWDSTATILMARDERISRDYANYYKDAVRLDHLNMELFLKRVKELNSLLPPIIIGHNSKHDKYVLYINQALIMYMSGKYDDALDFIHEVHNIFIKYKTRFTQNIYYSKSAQFMYEIVCEMVGNNLLTGSKRNIAREVQKKLNLLQ